MENTTRAALAQISNLRTDALRTLKKELSKEFRAKRAQELTVDSVAKLAELSNGIDGINAELEKRAAAEDKAAKQELAIATEVEALDEKVEIATETETEELGNGAVAEEDEEEEEEDTMTAAAIAPDGLESTSTPTQTSSATIVASADIPGMIAGQELNGLRSVADAFIARRSTLRGVSRDGNGDRVIVASARASFPEDRHLDATNLSENTARLEAVSSPAALTASGGLCAPLEPYYGIQVIADAARPVRDSLPKFVADRGGVRFLPPPVLTDLDGAVAITTAAEDVGPYGVGEGDTPYKPCLSVTCPSEDTVEIAAIHRCLTFGNFAARTYPEQVEAWLSLAVAQHARVAESFLLDAISAASTAVTAAQVYGATASLLSQVDTAVAGYRSRHRMRPGTSLRIVLPDWAKELLRVDLARSFQGNDLDSLYVSDAQILSWFTARNVSVTFYLDSPTGASQVFGAQNAGALNNFPGQVVWYLFVEGSFVHIDGGTLDLGLVRDSTLNSTNDYQVFAETFENVAFFGVESLEITSTICPDGSHSPTASAASICD
jgi:hypothetical protein